MIGPFFVEAEPGRSAARPLEHPLWRLAAFALALGLFLAAIDRFDVLSSSLFQVRRRDAESPWLRATLLLATYGISVVALVLVCCHVSRPARWGAWIFAFLGSAIFLAYRAVNGIGFGLHEASLLFSEAAYGPDTLAFFFGRYVGAIAIVALGLIGLAWAGSRFVPRVRARWVWAGPLLALLLCGWVHRVSFAKMEAFPAPYRVPVILEYARTHQVLYYGERQAPELDPTGGPAAPHIVFVMDESVSGDLLAINGGIPGTTPFLSSLGDRLFNWGVVSAISNLSSTTNIVIQSGLRPDQLPDESLLSLRLPNVFAYMERAGFATYYVDVQTYGPPSNFMTRFDVEAMDGFLQIVPLEVGAALHDLDHRAVEHIAGIVEGHERSFTYLLKSGAHIHYEGRYPGSARHFEPTLSAGELTSLNLEGADRERTAHSYLNALRWTVDDFARVLAERLSASGREVLVVYTADHGQSLLEPDPRTGRPERLTHNTRIDPPVFQAMVPLWALPLGPSPEGWLASRFEPALRDRVDQFALFPTLLAAAGYDRGQVNRRYGPDLFDPTAARDPRRFVSGDHLGRAAFRLNDYLPRRRAPLGRAGAAPGGS